MNGGARLKKCGELLLIAWACIGNTCSRIENAVFVGNEIVKMLGLGIRVKDEINSMVARFWKYIHEVEEIIAVIQVNGICRG